MDRKYFILNKREDYLDGSSYGLVFDESGIWMDRELQEGYGVFLSKRYDSREAGTNWSHMRMDVTWEEKTSLCVSIYAMEGGVSEWNDEAVDVGDFLRDGKISVREKLAWMKPYLVKKVVDAKEALLYDVKARYLWFVVEFHRKGEESPKLNAVQIFFPKKTWLSYLPEVYQMDQGGASFLERFLSVFQRLYEDMEQKIFNSTRDYDVEAAQGEYLNFLAKWMGMERTYVWTKEKLRSFLKNAAKHYKIRGTLRSVEELLGLYLDEKPYVVEFHKLEEFKKDGRQRKILNELYGDNPYCFTVLMKEKEALSDKDHKTILTIVNDVKPAYMQAHVVVIRPYVFLGAYSYLGINSVLGSYRPLGLDERSMIPFTTITGG